MEPQKISNSQSNPGNQKYGIMFHDLNLEWQQSKQYATGTKADMQTNRKELSPEVIPQTYGHLFMTGKNSS